MRFVTNLLLYGGYYLLSWFLAYVLTFLLRGDTLDFGFFIDYLFLAWTFTGFELPMFMWLTSLVIFPFFCFLVDPVLKRKISEMRRSS
jgi:hypothetical protein